MIPMSPRKEQEQTPSGGAVVEQGGETRQCYCTQGLQSIVQSWDKTCQPLLHVRLPTLSKSPSSSHLFTHLFALKGGTGVH